MEHTDAIYTYEAVAKKEGLNELTTLRYLKYMKRRWAEYEEFKCKCGYAKEWAIRFRNKVEFSSSDTSGGLILLEIDAEIAEEQRKAFKVIENKKDKKGGEDNEKK